MDENTLNPNRQVSSAQSGDSGADSFVYRHRKPFFWSLLVILMLATWYFSRSIETRGTDSASVFFSGSSTVDVIELYSGKADPSVASVRAGSSIEFVVKDDSRHYIAERKSEARRGDARISSGEFGAGESYSIQFNTPGSYSFYDRMNQDISIEVEVR